MKKENFNLDDFNILEMLGSGQKGSFSKHSEIPIISITSSVVGIGKKAIEFLRVNKNDRAVLLEKNNIWYIAILPFDSKINGYKVNMTSKNTHNLYVFSCQAYKRGLDLGYYKLLKPIFIGGLDLYELEKFEI